MTGRHARPADPAASAVSAGVIGAHITHRSPGDADEEMSGAAYVTIIGNQLPNYILISSTSYLSVQHLLSILDT